MYTALDISNGQAILFGRLGIRREDFERATYRQLISDCLTLASSLSETRTWNASLLEAVCVSLIVKLDAAMVFRAKWNSVPCVPMSIENKQHLAPDASIKRLLRELRNCLAHPVDGNGLPHHTTRINGDESILFHVTSGQEYGLAYPDQLSASMLRADLSFGSGHLRISLLGQIQPLLNQLIELPPHIAARPSVSMTKTSTIRVTGL